MNKSILKASLLGLLVLAVAGAPLALRAQTSNAPAATQKKSSRRTTLPFHGKLKAVDNTNKTISIGNETFEVTSETKITKDGKPATLADGVVGENVTGAYHNAAGDKRVAITIHFGEKAPANSNTKPTTP